MSTSQEFIRKERPVIIVLIAVSLALSVIATLYIRGERRRSLLLTEYRIERLSNALLETYRIDSISDSELADEITGFGVYDAGGASLFTSGDAPDSITIPRRREGESELAVDSESGTMTLVRPIGMPPRAAMGMGARRPAMMSYLFVRIRAEGLLLRRTLFAAAYVVVPVVIFAMSIAIAWLYYRNWSYRVKIDSQRNLVHLGEAARTLSHEIRNPLSAVQIQTGILRKLLPEERRGNLDVIDEEIVRLRDMVDRIRDFLKHPAGDPVEVDPVELVRELASRYSWELRLEGDSTRHRVRFDRDRLRSALENLIRNALEASPSGDPVTVRFERLRTKLHLSILDRGRGLPEGSEKRLFDPFFTTKEHGSGIGLAISRRFVEAAGGTLSVGPREGGGVEALVVLPAVDAGGER